MVIKINLLTQRSTSYFACLVYEITTLKHCLLTNFQLTEKQIRRPLAAMLPEKYSGVDIRDLFPEFRPGQVLRFSRLFPIKPSLKPRIWKNVKKRSKKKSDPDESEESSDRKGKSGQFKLIFKWFRPLLSIESFPTSFKLKFTLMTESIGHWFPSSTIPVVYFA